MKKTHFIILILLTFFVTACGLSTSPTTPEEHPDQVPSEAQSQIHKNAVDTTGKFSLGNLAYIAPKSMLIDEVATVELTLNPSVSEDELKEEISTSEEIEIDIIEVTPRMKAVLRAQNTEAFDIQALHDSAEQIVAENYTTRWAWWVKAQKEGTQILTVTVYRLITYAEQEYWWAVETYETPVVIKITLMQRIASWDWKWVFATIITAILIPTYWRWLDNKKKKEGVNIP